MINYFQFSIQKFNGWGPFCPGFKKKPKTKTSGQIFKNWVNIITKLQLKRSVLNQRTYINEKEI